MTLSTPLWTHNSNTARHIMEWEKKEVVVCTLERRQSWRVDLSEPSRRHRVAALQLPQWTCSASDAAVWPADTPPCDPLTCAPPTLMPPSEHAPLQPRGIHFLIFLDCENNMRALTMLTSLMPWNTVVMELWLVLSGYRMAKTPRGILHCTVLFWTFECTHEVK